MEPFDKIIKLLKMSSLWLEKGCSKCWIAIAVIIHLVSVDLLVIFGMIYLVSVQSIEDFSEAVAFIKLFFVSYIKSVHFMYNKNKIESIMKGLKEIIEHESWIEKQNGSKLKQRIRKIVKISRTFLASAMTGVFIGCLVPLFTHQLPLKMWFPYDYNNNETLFWLTVAYQNVASCCLVPVIVVVEMIPVYFMSYLTGIIEELCDRMGKICDVKIVKIVNVEPKSDLSENEKLVGRSKVAKTRKNQTKVEPKARISQMNEPKVGTSLTYREKHEKDENFEELLKCIVIQQKIKSLTSDVGDVFGRIIWFQGFMSTLVLCFSAFSLTVVSSKALKRFLTF
jgi:7tm Odorant receptor